MNTTTTAHQTESTTDLRASKDSRLNLRVTPRQDHLIRRAANALDKSVTEFIMDSVSLEAERVLADQRWFMLSETEWNRFDELLEQPIDSADAKLLDLLTTRQTVDFTNL